MTAVSLHLWGVSSANIPRAITRMATHRALLRRTPHVRFAKLLGTARSRTFTPRDTDPHHWGLLAVFDDSTFADDFDDGPLTRSWSLIAENTLTLRLRPLSSHGLWSGQTPFDPIAPSRHNGAVAAITRARIRPAKMREFWSASRSIAERLPDTDGLELVTGIGEAPIGLQGTFSVWRDAPAMNAFAHGDERHLDVIAATKRIGWYAEELFASFAVERATGSFAGRDYTIGADR